MPTHGSFLFHKLCDIFPLLIIFCTVVHLKLQNTLTVNSKSFLNDFYRKNFIYSPQLTEVKKFDQFLEFLSVKPYRELTSYNDYLRCFKTNNLQISKIYEQPLSIKLAWASINSSNIEIFPSHFLGSESVAIVGDDLIGRYVFYQVTQTTQ